MRKLALLVTVLIALFVCTEGIAASPNTPGTPLADHVSSTSAGGTTISMGTYAGAEYGLATELVYFSGPGYSYYKLSELDWPLEPMILGGVRFSLHTPFGLTSAVNLSSGLPIGVGKITDSDFLNGDGQKTHFSVHTATLEHSISARLDLGWRTDFGPSVSVGAFGRYLYRDIKWTATDGYLQYPPQSSPPYTVWSPSTQKFFVYGLVALYQQIYSIPAVGLTGEFRINNQLFITGSFAYSPFASAIDYDSHVLRSLLFTDVVSGATYLEPSLTIAFKPSPNVALTLDLSYLSVVSPSNGTIIVEDTSTGTITSMSGSGSTAGMSIQSYGASLGLRLAL